MVAAVEDHIVEDLAVFGPADADARAGDPVLAVAAVGADDVAGDDEVLQRVEFLAVAAENTLMPSGVGVV